MYASITTSYGLNLQWRKDTTVLIWQNSPQLFLDSMSMDSLFIKQLEAQVQQGISLLL